MRKKKRKVGRQLDLFTRKPLKEERKAVGTSGLMLNEFNGRTFRIFMKDGDPWWVASDVCQALKLKGNASQHTRRLDGDEKGMISIHTLGGEQQVEAVNEFGLYDLILRSKSQDDEVKQFRRWVTHEVLPSIRKTGGYHVKSERQIRYERRTRTADVNTIKARLDTVNSHLGLNKNCAVDGFKPNDFQDMHNLKYEEMFGLKASQIREILGMKPYETPLDRMGEVILMQVGHAVALTRKIVGLRTQERGSPLSPAETKEIMAECLRDVHASNSKALGPEFGYGVNDDPTRGLILDVVRNRLPQPSAS